MSDDVLKLYEAWVDQGERAAEMAYTELLRLPLGSRWRVSADMSGTLAALRDFLAAVSGVSPEEVQNEFERKTGNGMPTASATPAPSP